MNGRRLGWIGTACACAAIAVLSLLLLASRPPDRESGLKIVTDLRNIRETEERLSRLALEARIGRLDTYDPIVAAERRIDRLTVETEDALDAAGYPGRDELERYKADVAERRVLVARFESADAIFRNARAYFPLLSNRVLRAAQRAHASETVAVVADWEQVVFLYWAGRAHDEDVAAVEQRVRAAAAKDSARTRDLKALLTHGRTFLAAYRAAGDRLIGILDTDRGDRPNAVYRAYIERRGALDERAARIADALYVAAFLSIVGIVVSFLRLSRATTRLNAANHRLETQAAELARAQRIAGVGSYTRDFVHNTGTMSRQCRDILGVSEDYALNDAGLLALVHPDDRERVTEAWQTLHRGVEHLRIEHRILRPDRGVRWIHGEAEVTRDAAAAATGIEGTLHDITDLRVAQAREVELERQLLHSQRLEALGTLAGGIAHDLNNTLVPICSLTGLVAKRLPEHSADRENLDVVLTAGRRARDLVKQILMFSRQGEASKEAFNLSTVVREALRLMRPSILANIAFVERIGETPRLFGDSGQLFQVVINLVTNASQAIGLKPGRITVTLSTEPAASGPNQVVLSVADTGGGIDPAHLPRIFQPFFTTKPVNEGTGLGLSVVHGIITGHGGRIDVSSTPGEGTIFTVSLPAIAAVPSAETVDATAVPLLRAS
jgi:signal transduction histidine kinase